MTARDRAIEVVRGALMRTHDVENKIYLSFEHQAESLVAALEALKILRFDAELRPVTAKVDGELPAKIRSVTAKSPAHVISHLLLGPKCSLNQWVIGDGPDGADRIIEALSAAGYRIVKPVPHQRKWVAPQSLEFVLVESEG